MKLLFKDGHIAELHSLKEIDNGIEVKFKPSNHLRCEYHKFLKNLINKKGIVKLRYMNKPIMVESEEVIGLRYNVRGEDVIISKKLVLM